MHKLSQEETKKVAGGYYSIPPGEKQWWHGERKCGHMNKFAIANYCYETIYCDDRNMGDIYEGQTISCNPGEKMTILCTEAIPGVGPCIGDVVCS